METVRERSSSFGCGLPRVSQRRYSTSEATTTSAEALRDFINERLTAAAAEIFTEFQQTIVQYEEEIDRQRQLLGIARTPQAQTESPQRHIGHQKTISNLTQEEHEAPHIKEEEDVVEVTVVDGESDHSLDSARDLAMQQLTAAAGKVFTVFEQTMLQYEEEIDRQRKLLQVIRKPKIKLHRTEPQQWAQLLKQEQDFCLKQEEPEPPWIKSEPEPLRIKSEQEEPQTAQLKEEPEEPGHLHFKEESEPSQLEDHKELGCSHEGDQLIMKVGSGSSMVPSPEEQSFPSDPQEEPDTEQFFSQDSEVHHMNKHLDSGSSFNAKWKKINTFPGDGVNDAPLSETMSEGEKLLSEETSGGNVRKKQKSNAGTVNDNKKIVCEICGKICYRRHHLLVHMRIHTGEKPNCCEICGKNFKFNSALVVHMRSHTKEKPFVCETCGSRFSMNYALSDHMRTHTGEKPFSCQTCGKSFSSRRKFTVHNRSHTLEKKYSCEICGKNVLYQCLLLIHMRTHTGEKPYSCETCGKRFHSQKNLSEHVRTHASEKPFSCETCERTFLSHGSLSSHMRTHTGEKPYSCQTCGKCFSSRTSLSCHKRSHTGEKPYLCQTCGKSFHSHSHLWSHLRIHDGVKPYSCATCGKTFARHNSLLVHSRTHTGEKPYPCETCGRRFSIRGHLFRHMKIHKELESS